MIVAKVSTKDKPWKNTTQSKDNIVKSARVAPTTQNSANVVSNHPTNKFSQLD